MKKIIALLMVFAMLIPCAFAEEINHYKMDHEDSYKDWLQDTTPIELTIYTSNANVYNYGKAEERIAAETGITINYVNSGDSDGTGLMLLLASGDLPDIIAYEGNSEYATSFAEQAIASGAFYAFDDLIEQYAPHFFELVAADHRDPIRWEDGKFYWIENYINGMNYQTEVLKNKALGTQDAFLIREDWYKEVGSPDVTTVDGYIECLKAIKANHPEVKQVWGSPDFHKNEPYWEVFRFFGMEQTYVADDGTVKFMAYDPAAREAALFLNRMYREGLLSKDLMVMNGDDIQALAYSGEIVSYKWNTAEHGKKIDGGDENARYIALPPLETFVLENSHSVTGNRRYMISTNCENPDRAIQLIEYMWSIYGAKNVWGVQGESPANGGAFGDIENGPHWYVDENGKPTYYPEVKQAYSDDYAGTQVKIGGSCEIGGVSIYNNCCNWGLNDETTQYVQEHWAKYVSFNPLLSNVNNAYKTDAELTEIRSECRTIARNYTAKVIFAETEEEANAQFDAMLEEISKTDVEKLNAAYTAVYQANVEAYGK